MLSPSPAGAAAWTLEEGRTQIIFAAAALQATTRFDRRGRLQRTGRFSKQESTLAAERGLGDGLTLLAGVVGRSSALMERRQAWSATAGSIAAGLRGRLWTDGATVLSAQAIVAAGGERSRPVRLRSLDPPAEADLRLLLGHGFTIGGMSAFAEAQAGYRWRGGSHADELVVDATFGVRPLPRLMLLLQSFSTFATQSDRRFGGGRMRQHKLQPSLVWEFSESWCLQVGAFATVAGRETPADQGLVAAVWWRF